MASVHTTLVKNDANRALFEDSQGDTPLPSIRALPTAATASRLSSLTPRTTPRAIEKVTFSGGQFQLDADRDVTKTCTKAVPA
ncbi:YdgA family protein [Klebsiella pneumoniae]|nr:YdgA family protein [Klebsiella pneumoniae]